LIRTTFCHLFITPTDGSAHLKQDQRSFILADQQVTEMSCQTGYDILSIEPFAQYFIQRQDRRTDISGQDRISQTEIIFIVQYIQVIDYSLISDITIGKADHLVKNRQSIAHTAIGFLGNNVQCFRFCRYIFPGSDIFQMFHHIGYRYAGKIIYLATRQNSRKNFMFLGSRQNKQGMVRRFFQRFQERIESGRAQHVHLIDDEYFIFTDSRRNTHLIDQRTDIVYRVVGCCIQFMNVIGTLFVESLTGFALVAGFSIGSRSQTVDRLRKDSCTRSFSDTTRSAKQIGMSKLVTLYCIF